MSIRITLSGAEIGEVRVAMESQRDYYNGEIADIRFNDRFRSPEDQKLADGRLADLVAWRDACVSVLTKMGREGRSRTADAEVISISDVPMNDTP